MDRHEWLGILKQEPIVNSHAHHLPDGDHHSLTLESLVRNSYAGWCGIPVPEAGSKGEITAWLDAVRTRGFFVWLEKALMELYGIPEPLNADSWDTYDRAIRRAHEDRDWHIRLLREKCGYRAVMLDAYWQPGDDNGHPGLFRPVYRVNSLFFGFSRTAADHNGNNAQTAFGRRITDVDEYADFVIGVIREKKKAGCAALKCALAYDRPLDFGEATGDEAQKAFLEGADARDVRRFQDYVFDLVCRQAAENRMPLQIHTGLGLMRGSSAMLLQPAIIRHPQTTFLLMHGGYPWTGDVAGLTHTYPNVWADLCWLPLISTYAAHRLLHELMDVCNADRVVWGCDTWTGEESCGARLAFLDVLSRVLAERTQAGLMGEQDAGRYAKAVMHDNAAGIFGI